MRSFVFAFVVSYIAVSVLIVVFKSANGHVRQYGPSTAVGSVIEGGLLLWAVIWLATNPS